MSQRLSIPKTEAIGYTLAGQALFDLRGFAPDDDADGGDSGDGEDNDGGDGSGTEGGDDGDSGSGKAEDKDSDDVAALKARMQAADRRATAAEKKAQELADAALTETQRKEKEVEDLRSYKSNSEKVISGLEAQVAFLSNNDVSWQDPSIALSLLDLDSLRDENGAVEPASLKRAIRKLATEKPFLVKKSNTTDDEGGDKGGASGGSVGGKKKDKNTGLSEEELRKRYPSLYV